MLQSRQAADEIDQQIGEMAHRALIEAGDLRDVEERLHEISERIARDLPVACGEAPRNGNGAAAGQRNGGAQFIVPVNS
jgi:hypothetical protein